MSLLDKAEEALAAVRRRVEGEAEPPTEAEQKLLRQRADNETLRRINGEYFALIEQIEKEREEWKKMFFTASGEHATAQRMLNAIVSECAGTLKNAIVQLNYFRKAAGMKPIVDPRVCGKELTELPTSIPEDYAKLMSDLANGASSQTDGKAAREQIS